jgi:hypothetical protein
MGPFCGLLVLCLSTTDRLAQGVQKAWPALSSSSPAADLPSNFGAKETADFGAPALLIGFPSTYAPERRGIMPSVMRQFQKGNKPRVREGELGLNLRPDPFASASGGRGMTRSGSGTNARLGSAAQGDCLPSAHNWQPRSTRARYLLVWRYWDRDQVSEHRDGSFNAGKPWDVAKNAKIEGGHYIPGLGRDAKGNFVIVTWGKVQLMTPRFYKKYCDEVVAYVSQEALTTSGKTLEGFDLAQLKADLTALG